jgi:hypothetical protein
LSLSPRAATNAAALIDQAGEGVVELIGRHFLVLFYLAWGGRPIHFPGDLAASFRVLEAAGLLAFVIDRHNFVLVDERAYFSASVLEGVADGGALIVEQRDLLADLIVFGTRGGFQGVGVTARRL